MNSQVIKSSTRTPHSITRAGKSELQLHREYIQNFYWKCPLAINIFRLTYWQKFSRFTKHHHSIKNKKLNLSPSGSSKANLSHVWGIIHITSECRAPSPSRAATAPISTSLTKLWQINNAVSSSILTEDFLWFQNTANSFRINITSHTNCLTVPPLPPLKGLRAYSNTPTYPRSKDKGSFF